MSNELFKSFITWSFNDEDLVVVLDRCLEWLEDQDFLNEKGKKFASDFWEEYIWNGEKTE